MRTCLDLLFGLVQLFLAHVSQASGLDPEIPATITIDLGGLRKLSVAEIVWEFLAMVFTVSVSTDWVKWSEVYARDSNVWRTSTDIPLGSISVWKLRILMHEAPYLVGSKQCIFLFDRKNLHRLPRLFRVMVSLASNCCLCIPSVLCSLS